MKAHELAKKLLEGPDLPVVIHGVGSDEGFWFEATSIHIYKENEHAWTNSNNSITAASHIFLNYHEIK